MTLALGSIFLWQRNAAIQEVDARYVEFCRAMQKRDHATVYRYMSPTYRQTISFDKFLQIAQEKSKFMNIISFADACSFSLQKSTVTFSRNHATITDNLDFYNLFGKSIFITLEKMDGQWYFIAGPGQNGPN